MQSDWKHIYIKDCCPKQQLPAEMGKSLLVSTRKPENSVQSSEFPSE